jgi:hypothetical protein
MKAFINLVEVKKPREVKNYMASILVRLIFLKGE